MKTSSPQAYIERIIRQHPVHGIVGEYLREWGGIERGMASFVGASLQQVEIAQREVDRFAHTSTIVGQTLKDAASIGGIMETFVAAEKALHDAFEKFPERQRRSYVALAKRGWYVDLNMPVSAPLRLARAFETGDTEAPQEALVAYYEERLPEIMAALENNHPKRTRVLKAAFASHARHEYELSVPVFLAQADGICQELLDASPFRRRSDGKPATAKWVEDTASIGLAREALCLLVDPLLPICMNERERNEDFVGLNRHQVLHGESWDYGTQMNSLKAASFLNYIGDFLTTTVRRTTRE